MLHHHHIAVVDAVAGLHQAKACLLIQGWVITEPDHHSAFVCIEVEIVVTMEQRLEGCCGHHGFTCAGHGGQRERGLVALGMPQPARLLDISQRI